MSVCTLGSTPFIAPQTTLDFKKQLWVPVFPTARGTQGLAVLTVQCHHKQH